jgi:chemosensory pili system protein ChpA (sensor histidine kinase/response regulator)
MRGVLSVLGLDQASHAVLRMRDSVEQMLVTEIDEQMARAAGTFEHLGNNLGALSFLIDMLNYQPALAKKLFVYDEEKGELKPADGPHAERVERRFGRLRQQRHAVPGSHFRGAGCRPRRKSENLTVKLDTLATHAALAEQPGLAQTAREASAAVSGSNADAAATA